MRRTGIVLAFCKRAKLVGLGTSLSPHSLIRDLLEHRDVPLFFNVPGKVFKKVIDRSTF